MRDPDPIGTVMPVFVLVPFTPTKTAFPVWVPVEADQDQTGPIPAPGVEAVEPVTVVMVFAETIGQP